MSNIQYPPRVFEIKRICLLLCLIILYFILISCRGTISETIMHSTPAQGNSLRLQTVTPDQMTLSPVATIITTAIPTSTSLPTRTPYPSTKTPMPCPPFTLDTELPEPDIPVNYIGRHFRELPEGLIYDLGSVIRDENGLYEYGYTRVIWRMNRYMYWLEKLVCIDKKKGIAYHEIIDAIASPPLGGNETETSWCFKESELIPNIIAIGTYDPSQPIIEIGEQPDGKPYVGWKYNHIVFAFWIDMEKGRFIELDTTDLLCLEYPYGRGSSEP